MNQTNPGYRLFCLSIILIGVLSFLSGCVAGDPGWTTEEPAGFFAGLWHGLIVVVAFIISLFTDTVKIYEIHNTGGWYNFGFVLGILLIMGAGSSKRFRKKRTKHSDHPDNS